MPWWAILYVVFYFLLSLVGDILQFRDRTSTLYWGCESLIHFGVGVLMIGFWMPIVPRELHPYAFALCVVAVGWEIGTGIPDARAILAADDSKLMKCVYLLLPFVLVGPAYLWAVLGVWPGI